MHRPAAILALPLLILLCACLFFLRLAERDLWSSHEARAAQDAQTILADGRWGLPRLFDGRPELQKPPLYYWLVAVVAGLRGGDVDALAVRLPAAVAGAICVLCLFLFGVRAGRPVAGLLAAVLLATAVRFTWMARVGRIDMVLTLAVTTSVLAFAAARRRERPFLPLALGYLALAAAVLLKGPIGAALIGSVVLAHLLADGELPAPWRPRAWLALAGRLGAWWGLPLAAAVAAPWFLWANAATGGEFFHVFFWHHNLERGLFGTEVWRGHPWWFYAVRLPVDLLPGSVLLPLAAWTFRGRPARASDPEARLGLAWLLAVAVLLSCARFKRADYLLPAFPGAALFLGCALERCYRAARRPRRLAAGIGLAAAACVAGWYGYVGHVLPAGEPGREFRTFAGVVRGHAGPPETVVFFRCECHALAFHVGRPLRILVQWQDLDTWVGAHRGAYVVMPAEWVGEAARRLPGARLEELRRNTELAGGWHEEPLVLLRATPSSDPQSELTHARIP